MINSKKGNNSMECLLRSVDDFLVFVNQVLNDNQFIEGLDRLLPFDNTADATMNLSHSKQRIKNMGISLMRMDIEPALYSLAITLIINSDGKVPRIYSVFIIACKTIKWIQAFARKKEFRDKVINLCIEKIY